LSRQDEGQRRHTGAPPPLAPAPAKSARPAAARAGAEETVPGERKEPSELGCGRSPGKPTSRRRRGSPAGTRSGPPRARPARAPPARPPPPPRRQQCPSPLPSRARAHAALSPLADSSPPCRWLPVGACVQARGAPAAFVPSSSAGASLALIWPLTNIYTPVQSCVCVLVSLGRHLRPAGRPAGCDGPFALRRRPPTPTWSGGLRSALRSDSDAPPGVRRHALTLVDIFAPPGRSRGARDNDVDLDAAAGVT
jgi:hypothetical protein